MDRMNILTFDPMCKRLADYNRKWKNSSLSLGESTEVQSVIHCKKYDVQPPSMIWDFKELV